MARMKNITTFWINVAYSNRLEEVRKIGADLGFWVVVKNGLMSSNCLSLFFASALFFRSHLRNTFHFPCPFHPDIVWQLSKVRLEAVTVVETGTRSTEGVAKVVLASVKREFSLIGVCVVWTFFYLWRSPAPWRWGLRATYQVLLPGEHLPHLGRGHRSPGLPSVPSHSVCSRPGRASLSRRHW